VGEEVCGGGGERMICDCCKNGMVMRWERHETMIYCLLLKQFEYPDTSGKGNVIECSKFSRTKSKKTSLACLADMIYELKSSIPESVMEVEIKSLPWNVRPLICLVNAGVKEVRDIFTVDLVNIKNCGKVSLHEILTGLKELKSNELLSGK
jgi:hypothetical protein